MKAIALLARKGGSGKTTTAIHMGVLAAMSGRRVLFLDLDPQHSLTAWWEGRNAETPSLAKTDARRLPELLKDAARQGYDLAVVDTPPAIGFDTARVAGAVDLVLVPLRPSLLDIYAVTGTADVVKAAKTDGLLVLNAVPPARGVGEASLTVDARKALADAPLPVASVSLGNRLDYARALNSGEAVNEFAPVSKAAAEMRRLWREIERRIA